MKKTRAPYRGPERPRDSLLVVRRAVKMRAPAAPATVATMIDHGFCFNAGEWNFPDAPLRGIYARGMVYEQVRGMEAFEPWIARLEKFDDAGNRQGRG